jgi:hypothetical protein
MLLYFYTALLPRRGRDSSVGIASRYGLDGQGMESRWGRDFPHPSRPSLGPTQLPIQWVLGLFRAKRQWRGFDHPPHLAPRLKKNRAIPLLPIWALANISSVVQDISRILYNPKVIAVFTRSRHLCLS